MAGIAKVARGAGVRKHVVTDVFDEIARILLSGEPVRITGFGSFELARRAPRLVRTPLINQGEQIQVPESRVIRFKQSDLMTKTVRERFEAEKAEKAAKEKPAKKRKKKKKKPDDSA